MHASVLCVSAALLALPTSGVAQTVPSSVSGAETATSAKPASSPGAVSEKSLADWAASIRPDLEKFAGAKFDKEISIKVIGMDDLAQMLAAPIIKRMTDEKAARPDGSPMTSVEIRIRAMAGAFKVAARTFGMYWHEDKTVYVLPENATRYAKKHGWSAETLDRAPKLALAHEMVHAMQDQRIGLGDRLGKASGEERNAFIAVTEGQAVWVTDQLARQLDWPAANAVMWGVVTGVQTEDDAAGSEKMPKVKIADGAPTTELYDLGKKFIQTQAAFAGDGLKGPDRIWAVLQSPPKTMAELKDPEKFVVK